MDLNEAMEVLDEVKAEKTKVVRGGEKIIKWQCPPGYKKVGKVCKKITGSEKMKKKRAAIKAARSRKGKEKAAARKRKISVKKGKFLRI
jgi:hypothetical protein